MYKPVTSFGRRPMLRPEQKAIAVMRHIRRKFSNPGGMVLDTCMSTATTAKACSMDPKHQYRTECDVDSACVEKMMPSLPETVGEQVLNKDSDIIKIREIERAPSFYLKSAKSGRSTRRNDLWQAPGGPQPFQAFPSHITQFISQYCMYIDLF